MKIIKERTPVTIKEYRINFWYDAYQNAGFCFPANRDGTPDFTKMCPAAKANYEKCLVDKELMEPEFEVKTYTYMEPAIGKCSCGREVVLDADYMGAVRCECGRWYNLFGQSLIDPKYWYRDEDDYYSDMPD